MEENRVVNRAARVASHGFKVPKSIERVLETTRRLQKMADSPVLRAAKQAASAMHKEHELMQRLKVPALKELEKFASMQLTLTGELERLNGSTSQALAKAVEQAALRPRAFTEQMRPPIATLESISSALGQALPHVHHFLEPTDAPMAIQPSEPVQAPSPAEGLLAKVQQDIDAKHEESAGNPRRHVRAIARLSDRDWLNVSKLAAFDRDVIEVTGRDRNGDERVVRIGVGMISIEVRVFEVAPKPPTLSILSNDDDVTKD